MLQIKKSCSRSVCCTIFYEHLYIEEMLRVAQHDRRFRNIYYKKVNNKNIFQWKICNKETIYHLCNAIRL